MAVAYVSAQSGMGTQTGTSSSFSITLPAAVSVGSAICVFAGGAPSSGSASTWSIADNGSGNTYNSVANQVDVDAFGSAGWYAVNVQGSPTQLTLTTSSGTIQFGAILGLVFTGVSNVSPLDGHAINSQTPPGTGANAITSGSFSPATSGDLIVGFTIDVASLGGDTAGTGFTLAINDNSSYFTEYKLSGASGAQATTFTNATNGGNASGLWDTIGFALKAAVPTTLSPPQKQWQWVGNTPVFSSAIQTAQKQWAWAAHIPTLNKTLVNMQKAWAWVGNVPTLTFTTIINPPKAIWAWVARAAILSGGNIPHKVKEAFNVMRPILWGVIRGTLTWPTIGPEQ